MTQERYAVFKAGVIQRTVNVPQGEGFTVYLEEDETKELVGPEDYLPVYRLEDEPNE